MKTTALVSCIALAACTPEGPVPPVWPDPGPDEHAQPPCELPSSVPSSLHGTNVLVALLDDVGVDKAAVYGEHELAPPTPTLDALASEGVLFRNAYAYPGCSPTRAALLTGRYGRRTGVGSPLVFHTQSYALPLSEHTLPEVLAEAPVPYANAALGKWHLATADTPDVALHPTLTGFDVWQGTFANIDSSWTDDDGDPTTPQVRNYFHWEENRNGTVAWYDGYNTTASVDQALHILEDLPEPWVLYMAFHGAHEPVHLPPDGLFSVDVDADSPDVDLYDATLQAVDAELGRLLAGIDPAVYARTTVITMGDNGTARQFIRDPWPRSRSKLSPYDGGMRVPLVVTGPLVQHPGSETAALVHAVDVFATAADIACVDTTELVRDDGGPLIIDGESLVPWLVEPDTPGRAVLYAERFGPSGPGPYNGSDRVVRSDTYKLLETNDSAVQLFRYDPDHFDEGEDLLATGDLELEDEVALDELLLALDGFRERLVYEGD